MYNTLPTFMVIFLPFLFLTNPSLIFLWVILELSSIMFICMSLSEEEVKNSECFLMYFLVQSFSSAFLLMFMFSWTSSMKNMMLENPNNMNYMITILIGLKIAMGPLHFWMIKMSKVISWFVMGILLTWQKVIPLAFFSSFSMNVITGVICVFSLLIGTLSQMKLTSLKMLIAYSSISHLGWMMFSVLKCSLNILSYLIIYSFIVLPMMAIFFFSNFQYLFNQMTYKMMVWMSLMVFSLSGIPPLMGFLLKWMALWFMMPSIVLMMLFSLMACLGFYIYIRMIYKSFLMSPFSLKHSSPLMNTMPIWAMNFFLPIFFILW